MAINCDPNALAAASNAARFCCPSPQTLLEIQTYLLAQMANMISGGATPTDPNALAQASKAFQSMSSVQLLQIQTYLLCQIASVSGV